jgi:hypothetical protein
MISKWLNGQGHFIELKFTNLISLTWKTFPIVITLQRNYH